MTDIRTIQPGPEMDIQVARALGCEFGKFVMLPGYTGAGTILVCAPAEATDFVGLIGLNSSEWRQIKFYLPRWSTADDSAVGLLAEMVKRGFTWYVINAFNNSIRAGVKPSKFRSPFDVTVERQPTFAAAVSRAFVLASDAVTRVV